MFKNNVIINEAEIAIEKASESETRIWLAELLPPRAPGLYLETRVLEDYKRFYEPVLGAIVDTPRPRSA